MTYRHRIEEIEYDAWYSLIDMFNNKNDNNILKFIKYFKNQFEDSHNITLSKHQYGIINLNTTFDIDIKSATVSYLIILCIKNSGNLMFNNTEDKILLEERNIYTIRMNNISIFNIEPINNKIVTYIIIRT